MRDSERQIKVVIKAQCWEWYGCEDHVGFEGYGRYKAKGGADFVALVPDDMYWYAPEKIEAAFDEKMFINGNYFKYAAQGVEKYRKPEKIELGL